MAKLEELIENKEFRTKMETVETEDEARLVFIEYGVEMPGSGNDSLGEKDLQNVVGGRGIASLNATIDFLCGKGTANLSWKGLYVSAVCIYDYCKYGNAYRTYSKSYVKKLGDNLEKRIPQWMIDFNEKFTP